MSAVAVSIIVPSANGSGGLEPLIARIREAQAGLPHEIIVADSALSGFQQAASDRWIVMPAHGQPDPAILPDMARALETAELVVASGDPAGSRTTSWLAQLIINVPLADPLSDCFGIRREAFADIAGQMRDVTSGMPMELYYRLSRRPAAPHVRWRELPSAGRRRAGHSWPGYLGQLARLRKEGPWPQGLPKFICVGVVGGVVNCVLLSSLVTRLHWHHLLASAVAIQIAVVHNFIWHDRWTFKDRREHSRWLTRFWNYELVAFASMLINWLLLAILVDGGHQPLMTANLIGIAFGAVINFAVSKLWTWKRRTAPLHT